MVAGSRYKACDQVTLLGLENQQVGCWTEGSIDGKIVQAGSLNDPDPVPAVLSHFRRKHSYITRRVQGSSTFTSNVNQLIHITKS